MPRPKKVTMHDVAREAGVSYQTVSRVINDHPSVAPATRKTVLDVIKRLNYRPSKVARSLATRQSMTLAVITYGMRHYGPTQMVAHIEQAAKSSSYDLIVANIRPDEEDDLVAAIGNMERRAIDGLILIAPVSSIAYEDIDRQFQHLPIVQIDIRPGAKVPSVIIDQYQGGYDVGQHLIALGHRRIVEIAGPQHWYGASSRHRGFVQALADAQLDVVATTEGDWSPQSGYDCARHLLTEYTFTALVVGNDQMALGALRAIREKDLGVPEEISIVGFDDIPEAPFFSPALTTVRQDFSQLGIVGVEYLISMINHGGATQQKAISPELIIRQSTTSPKQSA